MNNIILIGMPGSGKSSLGVVLAKKIGFGFIDSDLVIQEREGMTLERIIEKHGDAGFKRKDQRSNGGIHIFLAYDLQGVGNTAGHYTSIQDRQPGSENGRNLRTFQNKCRDHGQDPADKKLDTGKLYTVCLRGKIVNHQNVQGKEKSTYQHQNISEANGKSVCDAEKIKSDQSHNNGCPDKRTAFLFHKKSKDRDDDNVACSEKTCFSNGGVLDTKLLEVGSKTQADTADYAAGN